MATDLVPSSLQARATRRAISPRLAIRTFWNTFASTLQNEPSIVGSKYLAPAGCSARARRAWSRAGQSLAFGGLQVQEHLLKLHPFGVLRHDLGHPAAAVRLDLVHDLHGLDNADCLALLDE